MEPTILTSPAPSPTHSIRCAVAEDIPDLTRMVAALARHHGEVARLSADELTRDAFGPMPWVSLLLAERENTCTGYAALCPRLRLQFGERGLELHHLFVESEHRRNGIGTALVQAALGQARSQSCDFLSVTAEPGNLAAQDFYIAQGFRRKSIGSARFMMRL